MLAYDKDTQLICKAIGMKLFPKPKMVIQNEVSTIVRKHAIQEDVLLVKVDNRKGKHLYEPFQHRAN